MATTDDQREHLLAAIKRLYTVFQPHRLNPEMHFCPCCVSDDDFALLRSRRLRELTWRELNKYAFKSMTTWGDDRDFRHFLPRIYELLALDRTDCDLDLNIALGKLYAGGWTKWPQEQQSAVQEFLMAWWSYLLKQDDCLIRDFIDGLCMADCEPLPFLNAWRSRPEVTAALCLTEFLRSEYHNILKGQPFREHYHYLPNYAQHWQTIERWLREPETAEFLARHVLAGVPDTVAAELSLWYETLTILGPAGGLEI